MWNDEGFFFFLEVGGYGKGDKQIAAIDGAYLVVDDTEYGHDKPYSFVAVWAFVLKKGVLGRKKRSGSKIQVALFRLMRKRCNFAAIKTDCHDKYHFGIRW